MGTNNFKTAVNELMSGKIGTDPETTGVGNQGNSGTKTNSQNFFSSNGTEQGSRSGQSSVISEDTIIEGNISGSSSIQVNGRIKGNLTTTKDVISKGIIEGDIKATNISLSRCSIKGNINASGILNVDSESIVVGNVEAGSVEISGRIKGDIKADEMAVLKNAALVLGNLTAKSVSLEAGAGLKGRLDILSVPVQEKDFKLKGFSDTDGRIQKDNDTPSGTVTTE